MNPSTIARIVCGTFYDSGKTYHSELPADIRDWYAYCSDGGHCIVCCLKECHKPGQNLIDYLIPVPVKAVLRGYEIKDGYVVVELPYSGVGLCTQPEDDEF